MSVELFDIVKVILDDIKNKPNLPPVTYSNIPKDSASMRMALRNPNEFYGWLNSNAKRVTGEINVQLSNELGSSQFKMLKLASDFRQNFGRGTQWDASGYRVQLEQMRTSSIYQSNANEHINVIMSFVCYCE